MRFVTVGLSQGLISHTDIRIYFAVHMSAESVNDEMLPTFLKAVALSDFDGEFKGAGDIFWTASAFFSLASAHNFIANPRPPRQGYRGGRKG